jgi:PAS domain S-box-containing protein
MNPQLPNHGLLSLIIDEAPQATLVLSPDGHVLSWGRAAQTLFGWTAEEAMGQPLEQLTGLLDGHPGLLQLHGRSQDQQVVHEVVKRRRKDGRLIHVEVAWRAVHDADGALRCFIAGKRDVSGEQLQRDVRLVGERYRDLLDSVPDAIVIVNDVGSIVLFNTEAAQLFSLGTEAMVGQPVESLIPERFARGHASHRERFASAPQRRPMGSGLELRGRRGDGSEFPVEVSLSPLMIGERRFVMAALRDLSERVRLEEAQLAVHAAQRASTAKTEFLSRMSHELRTPLNAVLGFAQLLCIDQRQPLSDKQRLQVGQILRSGRHLLGMINDLLDVSRIESGAVALSPEPLGLTGVLHEVLDIATSASRDAGLAVDVQVEPPACRCRPTGCACARSC